MEVRHAVNVVAGQNHDVHLLEEGGGVCLIRIQFSKERESALVSSRLIAVNGTLDVYLELGVVTTAAEAGRGAQI